MRTAIRQNLWQHVRRSILLKKPKERHVFSRCRRRASSWRRTAYTAMRKRALAITTPLPQKWPRDLRTLLHCFRRRRPAARQEKRHLGDHSRLRRCVDSKRYTLNDNECGIHRVHHTKKKTQCRAVWIGVMPISDWHSNLRGFSTEFYGLHFFAKKFFSTTGGMKLKWSFEFSSYVTKTTTQTTRHVINIK